MNISSFAALLLTCYVSLSTANVIDRCNSAGMMALTFDDGPAAFTGQLLDILKQKNVRATFHLTTKHLTDPAVQSSLASISAGGHLIGLRTEAEWDLMKMSDDQIRSSIARQANVMASFIGYYPKFVRLPYGGYDDRVLRAVESTGAVVTTHNLETYDYTNDGNRVVNAVELATSLLAPGAGSFIVVQHDGVQQSVAVSGKVCDIASSASYKLVTLDTCLGMGDMTKNKVALKGGNGGGVLPMANVGGKIPSAGNSPSGGSSSIPAGSGTSAGADEADGVLGNTPLGGKMSGKRTKNAGSSWKTRNIAVLSALAIVSALIL